MKFSINQSELQNALSVVLKGIATRSTLPILSGIYLDAHDDTLTLQATDLELSIQYSVSALIEETGKAVVPGKLFSDIVKNLPDAAVHVEAEDDSAVITCDTASFSIKTLDAEDFPGFPHVDVQQEIAIPFAQFASMVKRVARTVSKDESRAILTGVLITLEDSMLKMVATDSYRLAITETQLEDSAAEEFQAVISGSFLQEIASLPRSDENLKLALAENQIVVTYHDTVFINRRLEGNFPNYRQLLPDSYVTRVSMDVGHLIAGVKRTSLLGQTSSPVRFDINIASQTAQLSAVAQDVGSAQETLSCEGEGEDVEIAFNYAYVLDGLSSVNTDNVYLEVQSSLKPGIFKSAEGENFLYLVMPVRIS
ncbi:DNA polymerase III subunit beta [Eggerthella sinensis]|uniref:Beta sliding clamp n=1 Tax=Eggerthella sinensis TaxID=242230 RepID=A0A3N0J214_9ACTN|nr:DNA polymerase III subunit beta [Eggerthella sinensis]MCB7036695.1 DNA polymerase III subunit beta [Eggerthella sinensis]RDB71136.1 DNA polymerase III subunit beta [Eggerthella sinensis]RNM43301.1 DNA polymerase III subunit beta [Eggerthella sinensis]